jgi:2-iminobutanoate/2-iminopropanoate deaminase
VKIWERVSLEKFLTLKSQLGIDPETNMLVEEPLERVRQIFKNMSLSARENGSDLSEIARLVVYVADMSRDRPLINDVQKEIWGEDGPYPPRTIVEVDYLGDDFVEIDVVFRIPAENSVPIEFLCPAGAFTPTATWSLGIKTDTHVFVSGMRGINPATDLLVIGEAPRVRRAFQNMALVVEAGGGKITDAINLVIYVTDEKYLDAVQMVQQRFWDKKSLPPITVNLIAGLNDDDFVEIEGTFAVSQ